MTLAWTRSAPLVAWVLSLVMLAGPTFAWEPQTFEAFCGTSAGRSYGNATGDYSRATHTWYGEASLLDAFMDRDEAGDPNCLNPVYRDWIEDALADGLGYLADQPFAASPSPTRLGPVVQGEDGTPVVRVYLGTAGGHASTLACLAGGPQLLGIITFDVGKMQGLSRIAYRYVATHELTHVVQHAQPLWLAHACRWLPEWFSEGSADHLATSHLRATYPAFRPPAGTGLGRNLLGLRRYDVFGLMFDGAGVSDDEPLPQYRASSLLRFITERWHDGDETRWAAAMGQADVPSDGIAWFDELLRGDAFGVGQPLALVFPSFLASYGGWGDSGSRRWPHVGQSTWREHAFGGCDVVTISPGAPATLDLSLPWIAGDCVEVETHGVPSGQVASVEIGVRGSTQEDVDDLHLGGMSLGSEPVGGGPSSCLDYERIAPKAIPACVFQPVTAQNAADVGPGQWVRSWPLPQIRSDGGPWTTELVFARVPARPSLASFRSDPIERDYRVTFAVKTAQADTGAAEMREPSANANFAQDDATGLPTDPGVAPDPGSIAADPVGFVTRPRGGADDPALGPNVVPGAGIFTVGFSEGHDGSDEDGVAFRFSMEEGETLRRGGPTTVPATILGAGPRGTVVDASEDGEPIGRVTVLDWTDDHVHLRATGTYCWFDEYDPVDGCRETHDFEGEAWLAFGNAHDASRPYTQQDTPVQALYREAVQRAYGGGGPLSIPVGPDGPSVPGEGPPAEPGDGSDGAGATEFACDCSCETFAEIEEMGEAFDGGEITPEPSLVQAVTACVRQCAMQFATCQE